MTKPGFIFIGPMKAGTTWVHDYLYSRGDICLPKSTKESFFFDRNFDKGLLWYESHFAHFNEELYKCIVEVSPSYFTNQEAIKRIKSVLGNISIVLTIREPIARSYSHYLHLRRYGYTNKALKEAVLDFPEIIDASLYSKHLEQWKSILENSSIFILNFDLLCRNQNEYAREICRILDVDFISPTDLSSDLLNAKNKAGVAPNQKLASFARVTAARLKRYRAYYILNFFRKMGLRNLFYGKPGVNVPALDDSDRLFLEKRLESLF